MGFQPEDRGNQIWVRKSGSLWSAKELVDTINFVHLVIHHGYVIPDQRFWLDLHESDAFCVRVKAASIPLVKEHDGSEDAPFSDVAVDSDCSNTFTRNFVEYAVASSAGRATGHSEGRPNRLDWVGIVCA
jgi:hypothetical protein